MNSKRKKKDLQQSKEAGSSTTRTRKRKLPMPSSLPKNEWDIHQVFDCNVKSKAISKDVEALIDAQEQQLCDIDTDSYFHLSSLPASRSLEAEFELKGDEIDGFEIRRVIRCQTSEICLEYKKLHSLKQNITSIKTKRLVTGPVPSLPCSTNQSKGFAVISEMKFQPTIKVKEDSSTSELQDPVTVQLENTMPVTTTLAPPQAHHLTPETLALGISVINKPLKLKVMETANQKEHGDANKHAERNNHESYTQDTTNNPKNLESHGFSSLTRLKEKEAKKQTKLVDGVGIKADPRCAAEGASNGCNEKGEEMTENRMMPQREIPRKDPEACDAKVQAQCSSKSTLCSSPSVKLFKATVPISTNHKGTPQKKGPLSAKVTESSLGRLKVKPTSQKSITTPTQPPFASARNELKRKLPPPPATPSVVYTPKTSKQSKEFTINGPKSGTGAKDCETTPPSSSSPVSEMILEAEAHSFLAFASTQLEDRAKYEQFLQLLEGFYTDAIPILSVIHEVSEIFKGHLELLRRFKVFLPLDCHPSLKQKLETLEANLENSPLSVPTSSGQQGVSATGKHSVPSTFDSSLSNKLPTAFADSKPSEKVPPKAPLNPTFKPESQSLFPSSSSLLSAMPVFASISKAMAAGGPSIKTAEEPRPLPSRLQDPLPMPILDKRTEPTSKPKPFTPVPRYAPVPKPSAPLPMPKSAPQPSMSASQPTAPSSLPPKPLSSSGLSAVQSKAPLVAPPPINKPPAAPLSSSLSALPEGGLGTGAPPAIPPPAPLPLGALERAQAWIAAYPPRGYDPWSDMAAAQFLPPLPPPGFLHPPPDLLLQPPPLGWGPPAPLFTPSPIPPAAPSASAPAPPSVLSPPTMVSEPLGASHPAPKHTEASSGPANEQADSQDQQELLEAQDYVDKVRVRFLSEPHKYSLFLRCILDLKESISNNLQSDSPEIIQNIHIIVILLERDETLLQQFRNFFPEPFDAYQALTGNDRQLHGLEFPYDSFARAHPYPMNLGQPTPAMEGFGINNPGGALNAAPYHLAFGPIPANMDHVSAQLMQGPQPLPPPLPSGNGPPPPFYSAMPYFPLGMPPML